MQHCVIVKRYPEYFLLSRSARATSRKGIGSCYRHIGKSLQESKSFCVWLGMLAEMRAREWHIYAARQEFHILRSTEPVWLERFRKSSG